MHRRDALRLAATAFGAAILPPAASPGPRAGHALAFHGGTSALCLVGGDAETMTDRREQPWFWDGRSWTRPAPAPGPGVASLVAAASDPATDAILTYGGFAVLGVKQYGPPLGELWQLDARRVWRQLRPTGPAPGPRHHHAMAFDSRRGRLVLYGGIDAGDTWPTDIWEWDRQRWHRIVAASGPGDRAHHAMAYDAKRGRIVLRGGSHRDRARPTDTWEWDGMAWHRAAIDGPGPAGGYRMAYDAAREVTVLFGGDTCLWDGVRWTRAATIDGPPARTVHALAYDPRRARVVLYGGTIDQTDAADTWEWDGARWHLRNA